MKSFSSQDKYPLKQRNSTLLITIAFFILMTTLNVISCKKSTSPGSLMPNLQLVTDNLVSPVTVVAAPDDSKRLFVVDEVGKIWIITSDGTKLANPFID